MFQNQQKDEIINTICFTLWQGINKKLNITTKNFHTYYVPHFTFGFPVNPLAHAQIGFPVMKPVCETVISQTACIPSQMIPSHGSKS